MTPVSTFSVGLHKQRLYASAIGRRDDVIKRLRADDPCWERPDCYFHGTHLIDERTVRMRPTKKLHMCVR